ncbi:MAG: DUF294 nucleotidyltransferase-like domain-containing protein [Desulfobacterales bacterium]|nr:DUF294 nucleotidyltransferase-like domain-containing protein [Desulfobacterales bacterium]
MDDYPLPRILNFLKKVVPFNMLESDVLQHIVSRTEIAFYPRGEKIIRMGDNASPNLFIIQTGAARVSITDETGSEILIDIRGEGDLFGGFSVLRGAEALFNVSAEEDLIVFLISIDEIKALIKANPKIKQYFDTTLVRNIKAVRKSADHQASLFTRDNQLDIDMFLTGKRVSELMTANVLTCLPGKTVQQAARDMLDRRVGSIVVVDENGTVVGIVTDADLSSKILADGRSIQTPVHEIMSAPVSSISSQAYTFDALLDMSRHDLSQLVVIDDGQLAGIISERDFQIEIGSSPLGIINDIDKSQSIKEVVDLRSNVDRILEMAMRRSGEVRPMVALFAELNERVARRFVHIVEAEMIADGLGGPPAPYCWMAMGSEGRLEQTLFTDQDNALIYEDVPNKDNDEVQQWFLQMAERVVGALEQYGIPRCSGGIMASNPKWCLRLSDWEETFLGWIRNPTPTALRMATIFFDFRGINGAYDGAIRLRQSLIDMTKRRKHFFRVLAQNALYNRPPLGFLRQFVVEKTGEHKNKLNLKMNGLAPIVDAARVLALEQGLAVTNTMERLEALTDRGVINRELLSEIDDAYDFINFIRISHHLKFQAQGHLMTNFLDPALLNNIQRKWLKESFAIVSKLQDFLSVRYQVKFLKEA